MRCGAVSTTPPERSPPVPGCRDSGRQSAAGRSWRIPAVLRSLARTAPAQTPTVNERDKVGYFGSHFTIITSFFNQGQPSFQNRGQNVKCPTK